MSSVNCDSDRCATGAARGTRENGLNLLGFAPMNVPDQL